MIKRSDKRETTFVITGHAPYTAVVIRAGTLFDGSNVGHVLISRVSDNEAVRIERTEISDLIEALRLAAAEMDDHEIPLGGDPK